MRGKLYTSSVCSIVVMLHDSETWPVKKENKLALRWAEMKIIKIGWMCGIKITDRFMCSDLRIDDIITVVQRHRLRCYETMRMIE